jgi:drug/metabolite transporter (DMT)-like permease
LFPQSLSGWAAVGGLGLFCNVIGAGALFYILKHLSSGFVSVVMLSKSVISAILAWIIFAEGLSWLSGIVFVFVLSGIYLANSDYIEEDPDVLES